jgi:hypothetical protein
MQYNFSNFQIDFMENININISDLLAILSFIVSIFTLWLVYFNKGKVKITKPTQIFFGRDGNSPHKKVFIRTLLYSTADRGQYIENMYVTLTRNKEKQNFNIWVYGDNHEGLHRGSGLYVGKSGIASNHHFLILEDKNNFKYTEGEYILDVYIELVNTKPIKIYSQKLYIDNQQSLELLNNYTGIYFDWNPDKQTYDTKVDKKPGIGVWV